MKKLLKLIMHSQIGFLFIKGLKSVYSPPIKYAKKIRFKGAFSVSTQIGNNFKLYNNAFLVETNIFWLGIDNFKWENKTREIWCDLVKKSNCIFDVGANVGIFSVQAKANNANAKVVAFEPQPNIFDVLNKNNKINGFDIVCENKAVSNKNGTIPFYNHGPNTFSDNNTTSGSLNKNWRPEDQKSIDVEVTTLKAYVEQNKIDKVDLIKIDVETLEYEVLEGFSDLLLSHKPIIILEIQSEIIGNTIQSLFINGNYVFFSINENKGLVNVDVLGQEKDNNYLICPKSKANLLNKFIQ